VSTDITEAAGIAADIPAPDADAVVDPHWLELRAGELLPSLYMPPVMHREHGVVIRVVASGLIGIFLLATALGICLTYGPP